MNSRIRVHQTMNCSAVNGPGNRFVLWVQGCPFCCSGCFNPETRIPGGGVEQTVSCLLSLVCPLSVEGITVSGGEPFLQAEALSVLLREVKKMGLNTLVYTGFLFHDLKNGSVPGAGELLRYTDLLIDGPYEEDISPDGEWAGSGNQKLICLSPVGKDLRERRHSSFVEQEFLIYPDGSYLKTGI